MQEQRYLFECNVPGGSCALLIIGSEDEVVETAVAHAVQKHGYDDSPELEERVRGQLMRESMEPVGAAGGARREGRLSRGGARNASRRVRPGRRATGARRH